MSDPYEDTPESQWPGKRRREGIDGPQRHTYQVLREHFRQERVARRAPCHVCQQPIDYSLRHGDPWSWELDHLQPVVRRPDLTLVTSNFASSHSVCNKRRALAEGPSGDAEDDELGELSEDW